MFKNENELIKFIKNEVTNIPTVLNNELTFKNKNLIIGKIFMKSKD